MKLHRKIRWMGLFLIISISLPALAQVNFEQMVSIGLFPEQDLLKAVIQIKQATGYKGNLCSPGSIEYARFFIDWNHNNSYSDPGEDAGLAAVHVHDIPTRKYDCLINGADSKPISFAMTLPIQSKKKFCSVENLVKVKAILSWDGAPPAGNPNYNPPRGNSVESWVQIRPGWEMQVIPFDSVLFSGSALDEKTAYEKAFPSFKESRTVAELKTAYQGRNVPEIRYNFQEIAAKAAEVKANPALRTAYRRNPQTVQLLNQIDAVLAQQYNTVYEELKHIGYDYDRSSLSAVLTVKKSTGYCGTLCEKGSIEYVGFWAYVHDQIEQMCRWQFLGLGRVNVHDITSIPAQGLQYAVTVPADFSKMQRECANPQVLKIRAILSWNQALAATDFNTIPSWGNKIEAKIQLRPGKPNLTGHPLPYLWAFAHMPVENISGNASTISGSALGDGYANKLSTDGWSANESPFGGRITVSGEISGMPDISSGAAKLKYKVQYKKPADTDWQDMANSFDIYRRQNGVPIGGMPQVAAGGYYTYEKDLTPPVVIEVQDDVLAQFPSGIVSDGLLHIRLLVYRAGAPAAGDVPANHVSGGVVKIRIDNTIPEPLSLTMDAGTCMIYQPGDTITGKFSAYDAHFGGYNFYLLPYSFPAGSFTHVPAATAFAGGLPATGVTLGTYKLATTGLAPCGYVIKMDVVDRTIRDNWPNGYWNSASVGFCLLKKP